MRRLMRYMLSVVVLLFALPYLANLEGVVVVPSPTEETSSSAVITPIHAGEELQAWITDSSHSDLTPNESGGSWVRTPIPVYRLSSLFRLGGNALSHSRLVGNLPLAKLPVQQADFDRQCAVLQHTGYYIFSLRKIII